VVIEKQSNPFIPKRKIFVNILTKMRYSFLAKCDIHFWQNAKNLEKRAQSLSTGGGWHAFCCDIG
jgi:hypothetical protein